MSFIQLTKYDSSELFNLATEGDDHLELFNNSLRTICLNYENITSVVATEYISQKTLHHPHDGFSYVFLPVVVTMTDGTRYKVLESYQYVRDFVCWSESQEPIMQHEYAEKQKLYNRGYTIDRRKSEYNNTLVKR